MANPLPSDSILEKALRDVVRETFERGDNNNLTVKRMRKAAEESLGLQHDFFRYSKIWKARSKEIIEGEAVSLTTLCISGIATADSTFGVKTAQQKSASATEANGNAANSSDREAVESSPVRQPAKQKTRAPKASLNNGKKRKLKEKSAEAPEPKKAKSDVRSRERKKMAILTNREPRMDSESDDSLEMDAPNGPNESPAASIQHDKSPLGDESELSDLIDDSPKPRPKKQRKSLEKDGNKAKTKLEKKAKAAKDQITDDPDTEKIKSLQGWLLKCGIRKVWGAYLKPYETPKAKIKHLESMLSDVGMTGRFSLEKANQIKEKREMAADLEAVQEGDKKWGKAGSEEEDGRPKRRLAKGFQALDFLDDDDGEETT